jgi:hypothetical protein
MDYRYNASSDRRLPGGHSHDHSYSRPATGNTTVPTDGDGRPPPVSSSEIKEPSTSALTNGSRQARKEVSTTVIACRQWYVPFSSASINPYDTILTLPFSVSVVVAERYAATQQDPYATIASDVPIFASMMLSRNEEVQISVQGLARDHVKSGPQTDP